MAKTKTENNFTTKIIRGIISATSNKVSEDFKQEKPTKTVYIVPETEEDIKKLQEMGMTLYTPENEGKPYFIAKATADLKVYQGKDHILDKNCRVETMNVETGLPESTPNFFTEDIVTLSIIKVRGGKGKNDFYRLNGILVEDIEQLKDVEEINPFAELFKD